MAKNGFRRDLERLIDVSRPVALARFHDGEYHLLNGLPYRARSGWQMHKPTWAAPRIREALTAELPDYWVGISPPCDWPIGTQYYRPLIRSRRTFATVFWHSNYLPFRRAYEQGPLAGACVVSSGKGDYKVPTNGAAQPWDIDGLVDQLLQESRPILVAAGPCAAIIVHEYWRRCEPEKRQTILDIGAALDPLIHGRKTRDFHDPKNQSLRVHVCSWSKSVPFGELAKRRQKKKPRGWRNRRRTQRVKR